MLHAIRDGHDVALSWMKEWFGPPTLPDAAHEWREHVEVNRAWGQANPDRYHEIRYEDLATNLDLELQQLGSFLGREICSESTGNSSSALAKTLSSTPSHSGFVGMVAADNVGKWKSQMPKDDIKEFERIAGTALIACGYEMSEPVQGSSPVRLSKFSSHKLRVAAKTILPLCLGLSSRVGITLLPVINRRFAPEWRHVDI